MMPHSRSPQLPSSTDFAGRFGGFQTSTDALGAPHSVCPQVPSSSTSPILKVEASPLATESSELVPAHNQYSTSAVMSVEEPLPMQWTAQSDFPLGHSRQVSADYNNPLAFAHNAGNFSYYAQNGLPYNDNYDIPYPAAACPRSYSGLDLTGLPNISMSEAYPPDAYQIDPPKPNHPTPLSDHGLTEQLTQMREEYEHQYGVHIKREDHSDYHSPYSDMTRDSTPHDDPPRYSHGLNGVDDTAIDKEQPYAQLIYKALLDADGHTMILRDIYEWFKTHTDKAKGSDTKGWQNSIRHNLSMNGAFEKVDQPTEESRKGFMWRLTAEALREGVKSTTRYRSKQPNKRGIHRTQQPLPQRQASGSKGGQAARRSANLRRTKRMNDVYVRSVPHAFDPSSYGEAYPASPYYSSDEGGYQYNTTPKHGIDFGIPTSSNGLFQPTSYVPLQMPSHHQDAAYVLEQSPGEPLFTHSPSPSSVGEPRTPPDAWEEGVDVGLPIVYGEMGYAEYAG